MENCGWKQRYICKLKLHLLWRDGRNTPTEERRLKNRRYNMISYTFVSRRIGCTRKCKQRTGFCYEMRFYDPPTMNMFYFYN